MYLIKKVFVLSLCLFSASFSLAEDHENPDIVSVTPARAETTNTGASDSEYGIRYQCSKHETDTLAAAIPYYFESLGIQKDWYNLEVVSGALQISLKTPVGDTSTVDLHKREMYGIADEKLKLPGAEGDREVNAVSKKEILLALMQRGRATTFKGTGCTLQALKDNVGVRQNIAAWIENVYWDWPGDRPDGKVAWNEKYWHRGTPKPGVDLTEAFQDVFTNRKKYSFGCYAAAKIAVTHGVLDYYKRIKGDPETVRKIIERLNTDGEPLVDTDPDIDADNVTRVYEEKTPIDATRETRPGKIVRAHFKVAANNWIPGDWGYFLNRDRTSALEPGLEGSNSIYMGRDRFVDYYWEQRSGSYSYYGKFNELHHWNTSNPPGDISEEQKKSMERTSGEGGIVENYRWVPYNFGNEEIPAFY